MAKHTIESVKRDLPPVQLRNQDRTYEGILTSGEYQMAEVVFSEDETDIPHWLDTRKFHFPWDWIVNSLNENKPLLI